MRHLILLVCFFITVGSVCQENVGIGTNTPDNSALLELNSSEKGFLPPRLTLQQRNAIMDPQAGLIIFNTTSNCLEFFNGLFWMEHCGEIAPGNGIPDGIYVSVMGNDMTGTGTPSQPYRTIAKGVSEAGMQSKDTVVVSYGNYSESSVSLVSISNLTILGSYNPVSWQKEVGPQSRTNFNSSAPDLLCTAFTMDNCVNVDIDGIDMFGPNGTSLFLTSYGLFVSNSSGIEITDCNISSGAGMDGSPGMNGNPGNNAITNGQNGTTDFPGSGGNPGGGTGGFATNGLGGAGSPGGGIGGGNGGAAGGTNANGMIGMDGATGVNGTDGTGGLSFGSVTLSYNVAAPGNNGTNGTLGGGGGGGGMGGNPVFGDRGLGGGGGGYGSGGSAGTGGTSGGGSFAAMVIDSGIIFDSCILNGGTGGNGGVAGQGGIGGNGTSGGLGGNGSGTDGGRGGDGGDGGSGGHGGGGGGGPSYCIYNHAGSSITLNSTTLNIGMGGSGGGSNGNAGQNGVSATKNF